jgi:hypothetical protein
MKLTQAQKVKIVVKILRKKNPALTALEATHVAFLVVESLEKAESEAMLEKGE